MENNKFLSFLNTRFVVGLGILLAALVGAYTFYQVRSFDNTLTVTGSASKPVTSDHVKWVGSFSRIVKVSSLKQGYSDLSKDLTSVQEFLKSKNIHKINL